MRGRSLSLLEAAAFLGVCKRTVYTRIREGRLQTIRTLGGSQRVLVESAILCLDRPVEPRRTAPLPAPAVRKDVDTSIVRRREEDVPLDFGSH